MRVTTIEFLNHFLLLEDNEIFDIRKKVNVPVYIKDDGSRHFFLKNDDKVQKIDYGLFLLFAAKRFFLPFSLWDKVRVEFLDEDPTNFVLENLYLMYPEDGIESLEHPGFFYIPGYELTVINETAEIIRIPSQKRSEITCSDEMKKENKFYPRAAIQLNEKRTVGANVHRLLAIVFKNPPKGYPKLVVDHLNGKKWDYRLVNLEWVTYTVNNRRAMRLQLKTDGTPIKVKDVSTGEVAEYFSITEFARTMDVHPQYIVDAKNKPNHFYKDRWIIKDYDDETEWTEFEALRYEKNIVKPKARNVFTGKVTLFSSMSMAERLTGTIYNAIRTYLAGGIEPCIINGYEWKNQNDNSPWTDFNEYQIEIYKRKLHRRTRVYQVTDIETNEVEIHYGWKRLAELTGLNKRTVINLAAQNRVLGNRYRVNVLH